MTEKKLSIVLPIYNEAGNIKKLMAELFEVMSNIASEFEIIAVNDGSNDDSWAVLKAEVKTRPNLKLINFPRNYGQTTAINAGIEHSTGEVIILIDSDLENDPRDIKKLLEKLDEGYDVVAGWRKNRWRGSWLRRKLPSVLANWLISRIGNLKLHDYGCTLKIYKRGMLKNLPLYGEMHRFIPIYCSWRGGKVTELPVNYRKREYGKSKYGIYRTFRVILDLFLIKFLDKYMTRPIHFFGGIGFVSFFLGVISGLTAVILRVTGLRHFVATPLPVFSALFTIVGVQLIAMGILAEMLMRVYFEAQDKRTYDVKNKINF